MRVRKRLMACATVVFAILCTLLSQTPALAATGAHKAMHGGTITLTDSIAYTGATVGQEYELVGTLHTKNAAGSDAGVLKDADGQEVTKSAKFVPTETAGTATVDIDVDTMNLDVGTSIVAYNTVLKNGTEVATHQDITDVGMTVVLTDDPKEIETISDVGVQEKEDVTDSGNGNPTNATKSNGDADGQNGDTTQGDQTQQPSDDATQEANPTTQEDTTGAMTQDDEKAAPSEPQIPATFMQIDTNATNSDDGGFWIPQKDHVNIHDTITYSGATVGATYTVTGEVHSVTDDGKDGGIAKDSTGTPITAKGIFVPEEENGTTALDFSFDSSKMSPIRLCVFDTVSYDGQVIATHASTSNVSQMITIAATQTTDVSDMDNANLPVYAQASDVKGAADATETQQQATQGDITQTGDMMTAITLGGMFIALAIATIIAGRRLSENGNTLAIGTSIAVGGFLLLLALIMSVGVANAAEEAIPDDGVIATTTTEKPADAQTEAFTIVSGELTANGVSLTKEVGTTTTEVITKEDGTKEAVTKEKTAKDDPDKLPSNVNKEPTPVTEKKQVANNSGQKKTVTRTGANVYRLYSPSTGRHLLTASIGEAKTITEKLGWHWENVAFVMPNKGDADANVPVYRLYNKNSSEHFYTASGEEKNNVLANGWTDEGIAFYAPSHSGIPVYRLYNKNNGDHMFTASKGEYDSLKAAGWADEHVAFYAKSNEPLNLGKGFWMVSTSYAKNNNLERLWVDANGSIASNRLIDPANANDAGAGYKAYAKPDCTVVRGAWNNDTGYVYLADNDGRLYADKTGWLVTSQYDGGLQRYYMEKGQNGIIAAKIGSFKVDGKSYYGRSDKGYVVRGTYDDGVLIYHANNEGVITGTEPSKKVKAGGLGNRIAALACYVAGCADPEPAVTTGVSDGSRAWQAPGDPRYQNYKKLMDTAYAHGGAKVYASCIQAAIGVICATVDPDAVDGSGGVPEGYNYFNNHPNLYQKMAYSNMGNLKPGDVLVTVRGNHTIIYVGNQMAQTYHPGATGNVYEASFHGGKYPNIATYDEGKFGYQGFTVFRPKTVNSSPSRPTIDLKSLIGFEYASGEVNQITAPSVASADWFNNDKAFVQHCEQLASRYDSDTGMFICSDTSKCRFVVLQRQNDGSWKAVGGWNSAFGKLENGRSLTKRGAYKIVAKEEADTGRLYEGSAAAGGPRAEGNSWDIFYCNHSNIDDGGMVIEENGHSGLANGPLGKRYCSHGGTCLPYGLTEWVSKNCPLKTTVLVFDDTNPTPSWYQWD